MGPTNGLCISATLPCKETNFFFNQWPLISFKPQIFPFDVWRIQESSWEPPNFDPHVSTLLRSTKVPMYTSGKKHTHTHQKKHPTSKKNPWILFNTSSCSLWFYDAEEELHPAKKFCLLGNKHNRSISGRSTWFHREICGCFFPPNVGYETTKIASTRRELRFWFPQFLQYI